MVDLRITLPKIGSLSDSRSMKICTDSERFRPRGSRRCCRQPEDQPPVLHEVFEIAITTSVGAGRSAPKLANTDLNAGMTKIMMTAVMMNATPMIATG
jgi:hypothetical protein